VSALADQFKDLPSAEDTAPESEGDKHDQLQIQASNRAAQAAKVREAAQQRSAALKAFLAAVESRRRSKVFEP
jgi:hypothetical protein